MSHTIIEDRILRMERLVDAPVDLVFEVWSNAQHLAQWWGPTGFSLTTKSFDFVENGIWAFIMHGPDGTDYINRIKFLKIDRPHKLSYENSGEGDTAEIHFSVTITFESLSENQTKLIMSTEFEKPEGLRHVAENFGAIEGGEQHLARMKEYLNSLV